MVERRVLFVTVGTSAIRKELGTTRDDHTALQRLLARFATDARDRAASELDQLRTSDLFPKVVRAHEEVWSCNAEDVFELEKSTSAEMTSTWLLAHHQESGLGGKFAPGEDQIVLLASDTAVGRFCAHVNAELMHRHLLSRECDCGTDFGELKPDHSCPAIAVEVVNGMEARRGLGTVLPTVQEICEKRAGKCSRVLFNITGGYKGVVPAITWLATNIFKRRATMFYQHEDVWEAMRIQFLEDQWNPPSERTIPFDPHIRIPGD